MAKTELGCQVLIEKGHLAEFAHFIRQHGLESEDLDLILKLKSILWAVVSCSVILHCSLGISTPLGKYRSHRTRASILGRGGAHTHGNGDCSRITGSIRQRVCKLFVCTYSSHNFAEHVSLFWD